MSIIRNLGTGYYGIELTAAPVEPNVLERISSWFHEASLIPESKINFINYGPHVPLDVPQFRETGESRLGLRKTPTP